MACVIAGGVAGGMLSAWGCHRRLLALEENLKIILVSYDDRLNLISKIITRQDKSAAAEARWSGKEKKETEQAGALLKLAGNAAIEPAPHPWDPRTWGKS